jgi:hypothetical protein
MRSAAELRSVLDLVGASKSDSEVARLTGIPRTTVRDWRRGSRASIERRPASSQRCLYTHEFSRLPSSEYAYLLGEYLGDGYLARCRGGVWQLRISTDALYPGIIRECGLAMEAIMPRKRAHTLPRGPRCVVVSMYSKHWPCLFPQHGPGRKHERVIRLEVWQEQLIQRDRETFIRGLIHSDGCRVIASDRGVKSVRYHFSNRSEDIKALLCESLDAFGIPWTRPSDRQIAIYRKDAVGRLDQFVGPKR